MNIIALRGRGNSGKSITIRMLHDLLLRNGYQLQDTTIRATRTDFRSVFKLNNKLIGITSTGDTYDLVQRNLDLLINDGCTICVCACRTYDRGNLGTNAAIDSFTAFAKSYVEKNIALISAQEITINQSDATILFNEIAVLVQ